MSIRSFQRAYSRRQQREQRRASALRRKSGLVAGLALSSTVLFAANAQAAAFTVTGNGDGAGSCTAGGSCTTLRAAINAHNGAGAADTITFASSVTSPINLGSTLQISGSGALTITGPGASNLVISGQNAVEDMYLTSASGAVTITGLTLTQGKATTTGGGAINSRVALTLTGDVISDSTATNNGGGILASGDLTLSGSTVTGNSAPTANGGGVEGPSGYGFPTATESITNSTISGNTAINGGGLNGGAIVDVSNTQITDNHAVRSSGGGGYGGGVNSGRYVTVGSSTVSGNTSTNGGGGIEMSDPKYGMTVSGSTVSGNSSPVGGGIQMDGGYSYGPMRVLDSTVSGNQATDGAGIEVSGSNGSFAIDSSTMTGNSGGANSFGGGLLVDGEVYGKFEMADSTVSGNSATTGAGVSLGSASHHPLTRYGATNRHGTISFDNSTIAGNAASAHGGGMYLGAYQYPAATPYQSGTANLTSTIVAGNTAAGAGNDLERAATSTSGAFNGAFSLIQNPGSAPLTKNAVITGVDPQLGALASNGGATQTMLPSGTSPVIDQGKSSPELTTDQRGLPRLVDTAITNPAGGDGTDIGAVELPAVSVFIPPVPPPTPPTPSGITLSLHGANLGLASRPLLVGDQTPVTCSVKTGTLNSCVIEVRVGTKIIGSGEVTGTGTSLTTMVTPTKAGLSFLKNKPLGADSTATLVASQTAAGSPTVTGNVHFLAGPSITVALAKRSAKLSKNVVSELDRVAKLLTGAKTVTCTAYTDKGKHDGSVTHSQATTACARLKKDGLKSKYRIVARGHANPISKTRATNRRLVISFTF